MIDVFNESDIDKTSAEEIISLFWHKQISDKIILDDAKKSKEVMQNNPTKFINNPC